MLRKVCVVITARPSYSRIKSALTAISLHPDLDLQLVVGASALLDRYGSAVEVIEKEGFEITERVYMVLEGENLVTSTMSTGLGVVGMARVFENIQPDVVVTIGDRFETLATAMASSCMTIPLVHVQGGEVTGSIDEKVRHAVTKLSNLHFVSHEKAAERVIRMGEDPSNVFVTGCPSIDLAVNVLKAPNLDFDPFERYLGVGAAFPYADNYVVVLQHPVTTEYQEARWHVSETLHAIKKIGLPAFWFWPNPDAGSDDTSRGIRSFREQEKPTNIHFFKNMFPEDFLKLVCNARCIVGNSSLAIRECAFLGVPAVDIGTRQKGRERGSNVKNANYDRQDIVNAIQHQLSNGRYPSNPIYGDGRAGKRIAHLLAELPLPIEKQLSY